MQILNRILQWVPYVFALVLFIAMLLVLFEPSPQPESGLHNSRVVSGNKISTDRTTGSSGIASSGITRLVVRNPQESSPGNAELNFDAGSEDSFAFSENTDLSVLSATAGSENAEVSKINSARQSEPGGKPNEIQNPGDRKIAGLVQDVRGQPVSSVTIELRPESPLPDASDKNLSRLAHTDSEGKFIFRDLDDIDYRLTIHEQGVYGKVSHVTRSGMVGLVLLLPDNRIITIQGHVSDINDQPVPGVSVSINGKNVTVTDSNGNYQVSNTFTINSNYRIGFSLGGFREVNKTINLTSTSTTINTQLQRKSQLSLTGQVVSDYGLPLPNASIWLYSGSAEIERRTTSDNDGYFKIDDLVSGSDYQLKANYTGHERYAQDSLTITQSSQPLRIELKTLTSGTLGGKIVDSIGFPIPNYAVTIISGSPGSKIVTSDNAGQFEPVPVYEGAIIVSSVSAPYTTISDIKFTAGQNLLLTLVVDHGDYEIFGKIIDSFGQSIPGAQIKLSWTYRSDGHTSNSSRLFNSDASGQFRIKKVGPGLHALNVAADGYENASLNLLSEQQTGPISIVLNR